MSTKTGQVMTLANSIIGVSILAMPYCFKQCGIVLSILLLFLSSILSRFACHFLLKAAVITRRRNYEFLAFHVFGSTGKLGVELAIIGFLLGTCIAFFVVMGDLGPAIISSMLGLHKSDTLRTSIVVGMAVFVVLPLGLLRNVDSLSSLCTGAVAFYVCLILKVMGEATGPLISGDWLNQVNFWRPEGILQCVPIFSMALFCQTQLFEIFDTIPNASLDKVNAVIRIAINMCTAVYISVGFFGYVAFSKENITGNILVSLSQTMSSEVIKLGFVFSVAVSFPLVIFPCRASLYSLLYRSAQPPIYDMAASHVPEGRFKLLTFGIVGISLVVGLLLPNIERVLGIIGSTIGITICIITPALLLGNTARHPKDRLISQIIMWSGAVIMILGTYAHILSAGQPGGSNTGLEQAPNQVLDNAIDRINEQPPGVMEFQSLQSSESIRKVIEMSEEKAINQHSESLRERIKSNMSPQSGLKNKIQNLGKDNEFDSPQVKDSKVSVPTSNSGGELKVAKVNEQMPEPPGQGDTKEKHQEPPVPVEAVVKKVSSEPVAPVKISKSISNEPKVVKKKIKPKEQFMSQKNKTNVVSSNKEQEVNQDAIRHEDAESALEAKDDGEKIIAIAKAGPKDNEVDEQKKKAEEQKLIETLKEHQEVQRDMLNEQQRILQELKKHEHGQPKPSSDVKDSPAKPKPAEDLADSDLTAKESNGIPVLTEKKLPQDTLSMKIPNNSAQGNQKPQPPVPLVSEGKAMESNVKGLKVRNAAPIIPIPLAYSAKASRSPLPPKLSSQEADPKPAARDILESGSVRLEREKRDLVNITIVESEQGAGIGPVDKEAQKQVDNELNSFENTDNECAKKGSATPSNNLKLKEAPILELKTPAFISEPRVEMHSDLHDDDKKFPSNGFPIPSTNQVNSVQSKERQ